MHIEELIKAATKGNKKALEDIAAAIKDPVYYLALRMLVNPEDAKDATQEILIKVITNLASFRFNSQFNTWVYRIAANHLISEKLILSKDKDPSLTFDRYKTDLESDLQEPKHLQTSPDYQTLLNELRISCTMAMLLCLSPAYRMAYILGDIFEMDHLEASTILDITKDSFRKQLSRARAKVIDFTSKSCGLVSKQATCHCEKKISGAVKRNRVNTDNIIFSSREQYTFNDIKTALQETQKDLKTLALQTSIHPYKCPVDLGLIIESLAAEGIKTRQTSSIRH